MSNCILFLDMNSYFASVEQEVTPEARGRPLVVAPAGAVDSACCIAASIEAKRHGARTGMTVGEARRACPGLIVAPSRPRLYIEYHHRIVKAVETIAPVHRIESIDEMYCVLGRRERERPEEIARRVKQTIRTLVGEHLRCSIGLAPNRFLAKVGTELQKPDGLVRIRAEDLPHALFGLKLRDLPGIGPRMDEHLRRSGVATVQRLCELSEGEMADLWGSVVGRYWWIWLRGGETRERATRRRSIGHQHVLPPDLRTDEGAWGVAVRLLAKAASRLRAMRYWAERLSLTIETARGSHRRGWSAGALLEGGCQDTVTLAAALRAMWLDRPAGVPLFVDVTLHDLIGDASVTQPLFPEQRRRTDLARLTDVLDAKHGRHTLYPASMHATRDAAPGGIAFAHVPDLDLADSVR